MIYAWTACCIGCLFVGYLVGADRGYRKAHTQQLKKTKCTSPKCTQKKKNCSTQIKEIKKLRLVQDKNDDTGQW